MLSCVQLIVTPWTVAHQAPLSMGILQQKYWSGLPCPPLEDLPNSGIKPRSPILQVDSLPSESPPEGRASGGPGPGLNHKDSRAPNKVQFSARQVWKTKVKVLVGTEGVTFKFLDPLEAMILFQSSLCSVAQSCPIPCDPVDHSLPGSSVHGILQARILEWAAISLSRGSLPY